MGAAGKEKNLSQINNIIKIYIYQVELSCNLKNHRIDKN